MTDSRPRVLVVEDEAFTAINLCRELTDLGYDVPPPVATGARALEAAADRCPDVVLMDINLPGGMDGVETARRLRSRCDAALIFMTGYTDAEVAERTRGIGVLACLAKPVDTGEIDRIIREVV